MKYAQLNSDVFTGIVDFGWDQIVEEYRRAKQVEGLFADRFSPKLWKKTWKAAGPPRTKFHDLRKTFASLLAQRGVSTAVTQRLLEHSTPQLTNDVYTNVDPVLRQAIQQLPVSEWV